MSVRASNPSRLSVTRHEERSESGGSEVHRFELRVPSGLCWFEGHFDGHPVLPAIVQIEESLHFTRSIWPELSRLRRVTRTKFREPIPPEARLVLALERKPEAARVTFEFRNGANVCSSGVLDFELPPR